MWLAQKDIGNLLVRVPMYFMFIVTLSSLVTLLYKHAIALVSGDFSFGHLSLAFLSLVLSAVAVFLLAESRKRRETTA